jgi:hypothetical protein
VDGVNGAISALTLLGVVYLGVRDRQHPRDVDYTCQ